ncbi:type I restriction enzyme, S subunit [Micromonospora chokoriensis]|uniref:Type I restriction enzyme, S subunit n=2 Tax=Micromonospora chokoriensis TaxID=356851 RepID=A0A1C4UDE5_9ACTN|nr:type I restriction enzyme, S subunit [Micromonospora chokoriensis]
MSELREFLLTEVAVCHDSHRRPIRSSDRRPGLYPYYGASGVIDYVDGYLFDGEYLLLAEDGENLRTRKTPIAFIADGRFWVNNHAHVLQGNELASTRYLAYVLQELDLAGFLSGSTQPKLTQSAMSAIRFKLPPRPTQDSVVSLISAIDEKASLNNRIVDTALELANARYAGAMISGGEPRRFALGDLAQIYDGPHATPKKTDRGPYFLSISSLGFGSLDLSKSAHLDEASFVAWTRRVAPGAGDVLFSYETRLGVAALMPPGVQACLGRRMGILRPKSALVSSSVLLHAYLASEFQEVIRQKAVHGATVDRIPLSELGCWEIVLPDAPSTASLAPVLHELHERIWLAQRENEALLELRGALLPRLMSGDLRIRNDARLNVVQAFVR